MENPYIDTNANAQNNASSANQNANSNSFNYGNFVAGTLIGAAAAYILTNKNAQEAIFRSVVKMGKLFQAGSEELKERFEDAKAEIDAGL